MRGPRIGLRTGAIVVGLAVLLPLAAGAAVWAAGVPLLLPDDVPAGTVADAPSPGPRTLTAARSPAVAAVEALLAVGPGTGWSPAGPAARATTSVIDAACPVTAAPAPTLTAQRAFSRGRTGITVAVEVHGAGLGGQALDRRRARLGECAAGGSLVSWPLRTRTVSAVATAFRPAGATSAVSSLIWRRGDVVLAVLAPGERPEALMALADAVDVTALRSLAGRCADLPPPPRRRRGRRGSPGTASPGWS